MGRVFNNRFLRVGMCSMQYYFFQCFDFTCQARLWFGHYNPSAYIEISGLDTREWGHNNYSQDKADGVEHQLCWMAASGFSLCIQLGVSYYHYVVHKIINPARELTSIKPCQPQLSPALYVCMYIYCFARRNCHAALYNLLLTHI